MSTEPVVYVHGGGTVYVDAGTVGIPALHVRR
jgi:hypothetical protein